ncbi:MAG: UDP-glucose 6-dehydrogenase TuaD [Pseudomonadota bacterium]
MKVVVVGAGYVGLVTAACLAESGTSVVCVDQDVARVTLLKAGGIPIYEPGLEALVQRNMADQRLAFTHRLQDAVPDADLVFIAVGTPPNEDGSADLRHVLAVAASLGEYIEGFTVVVNKSTVPVGTGAQVEKTITLALARRNTQDVHFAVVSNPEFLKEGAAIDDFMRPDRIVIGVPESECGHLARALLERLYMPFNRHHDRTLWMDVASAELTKYAANAMLATRISFMNEIAALADHVGADVDSVRRGIGADSRIGHSFLYAGTGYGGSCFPKDTRALVNTAQDLGMPMNIVRAVEAVNAHQRLALVRMVQQIFGSDLRGHRFAIWGLAFKPNTNDVRDAPAKFIAAALMAAGAHLHAYDPVATDGFHAALMQELPDAYEGEISFADTPMNALDGADALLVVTEWKSFHNPDFEDMKHRMRVPLVLDGRNLYHPAHLQQLGIAYHGIGRRNALGLLALQNAEVDLAASSAGGLSPANSDYSASSLMS